MKINIYRGFIFFILFLNVLNSQEQKNFTHNSLAEKIYLQLDSEVYTTDNTIWFKAILANAAYHNLEMTSGVLYVDLISFEEEIIESKLIKITDGIGSGFFELDRSYPKGIYQIRAYTEWNKNFENDFVFEKTIQIYSIKDAIDNESDVFKSQIEDVTKTNLKTTSSTENYIDIQFFPESGKLINGLSSKIGFKAIDTSGKGLFVKGEIVDSKNNTIVFFESNSLGMGHFILDNPKIDETYRAILKVPKSVKSNNLYSLPKVVDFGYSLKVLEIKNVIVIGVRTNIKNSPNVSLKASLRGLEYFNKETLLNDGQYIFTMRKTDFPEGVIMFTLSDNNQNPLAERLFFNKRKDSRLNIEAVINQTEFSKRSEVKLNLSLSDNNTQLFDAHSSILVLDKTRYSSTKNTRETILTNLLLSSDLKGKIEAAESYFSDTSNYSIDDLMLTQGWRNYKYNHNINKNFKYIKENEIKIKGVANIDASRIKKDKLDVLVMSFGDDSAIFTSSIDVPSSFSFGIKDVYGGSKTFVLEPLGLTKKEKKFINITLSQKDKLPIVFDSKIESVVTDGKIKRIATENKKFRNIETDYFKNAEGVNVLDEVVIDGYKMTPTRKKMFEKYGEPDVVITGAEIEEKTTSDPIRLHRVLYAFRDRIRVRRNNEKNYFNIETLKGGMDHISMVVVDGIPVKVKQYFLLENISAKEVTSVEVIDDPKQIKRLYSEVNDSIPPPRLIQGSIIAIYTKAEKGLFGALNSRKGIKTNEIQVFSAQKEFYTPKYDSETDFDITKPDLRPTIYWNPNVKLINKKSEISYYHSDNEGDFIIIIESITTDGKIGYKEIEYTVNKIEN